MGKRYYCDYCDKSFADNPTSRKTHLTGVSHLRNKKAHYDACRDEEEILQEELSKRPCKGFLSTGECRFGDRCQFSHLSNDDKVRMAENIRLRKEQLAQSQPQDKDYKASLKEWCEKWKKRQKMESDVDEESTVFVPNYHLPESLSGFMDLPPSVLPPTKDQILNAPYPEWS